jgi:hypothetical protein
LGQYLHSNPIQEASKICSVFCSEIGACFSLIPTEHIYSGGRETGVTVRIINYSRFPRKNADIEAQAIELAKMLMMESGQASCSIETPEQTIFMSRRRD